MNVLVYTSLFPSAVWPTRGIFILERMRYVAAHSQVRIRVVAPVPYYPSIGVGWRQAFTQVPRTEQIEGFEIHHPRYVMTPKIGMMWYGLSMGLCSFACLRALIRSFPIDLIDAHFAYPDGVAAALLSRLLGVPLILTVRGSDINVSAQLPFIKPWVRWSLRTAEHIVAVSHALAEQVVALGADRGKISVIPNGIDPHKFYRMPQDEARAKLGLPNERPIVLSVGQLAKHKGMDLLVEAIELLRRRDKDLVTGPQTCPILYLIGDGPDRSLLERQIRKAALEDSVRLIGPVAHHELIFWYNAADVFCLASQWEGCPNVVKEALACGTPVLASPVGGIPEMLDSPVLGQLVSRSAQAFARAIGEAIRKEWDRQAISLVGPQYTWEHVRERITAIFSASIARRANQQFCRKERMKDDP